jgi:hypothetical protein
MHPMHFIWPSSARTSLGAKKKVNVLIIEINIRIRNPRFNVLRNSDFNSNIGASDFGDQLALNGADKTGV